MELFFFIVVQLLLVGLVMFIINRRRGGVKMPALRPHSGEDTQEMRELAELRKRSLNLPLSEKARPREMDEIIGQEDGIRALRAALCGPNPQHVLIYGPPGIGKTCAARLVLEEAKLCPDSPFDEHSLFIEVDATCVRFDERSIADPLLGSVHDPIYQGAGVMGSQGIPQPKAGAVTRAHCGVLFLDEIGELHPTHMNKLLKVLEDRRVCFESSYYSEANSRIPKYIHDIFKNGLPADFRLVGATTRAPEELPPALRSRCAELYFKSLTHRELERIAADACQRLDCGAETAAIAACAAYSHSGRDAVNIIQLASGIAYMEGRASITAEDVLWVSKTCRFTRRMQRAVPQTARAGFVCGLGVAGNTEGVVIEIECAASPARNGHGAFSIGGVVAEEEISLASRKLRRKSSALASAENVLGCFRSRFGTDCRDYDISFNVPGGMPLDGPSAGIALAVALMSAVTGKPPLAGLVLTGEIGMHGAVLPVGGVREKLAAAAEGGAKLAVIPADNWDDTLSALPIEIHAVRDIGEVMRAAFGVDEEAEVFDMIFSA